MLFPAQLSQGRGCVWGKATETLERVAEGSGVPHPYCGVFWNVGLTAGGR